MAHKIHDVEEYIGAAATSTHQRWIGMLLLPRLASAKSSPKFKAPNFPWLDHSLAEAFLTFFVPVESRRRRKGDTVFKDASNEVAELFAVSPEARPGVIVVTPSLEDHSLFLPLRPCQLVADHKKVAAIFQELFSVISASLHTHPNGPPTAVLEEIQTQFNANAGASDLWSGPATAQAFSMGELRLSNLSFFKGARQDVQPTEP